MNTEELISNNKMSICISSRNLYKRKMKWKKIMKRCIFTQSLVKEGGVSRIDSLPLS
jgi:hypothetical protein